MSHNLQQFGILADMVKEGFIYIDKDARIQIYNKSAKEIFRIDKSVGTGHPGGSIKKGDIVIIGDNCLGKDDGGLEADSLIKIGIRDPNIAPHVAFLGMGLYEDDRAEPVYEYHHTNDGFSSVYELKANILGYRAAVKIEEKTIAITFGEESFLMSYHNSIGHIVVVDPHTGKVKFYQTGGYTARGESVAELLSGKPYRAKGPSADDFDVIGKNIFSIQNGVAIQELYKVARGGDHDPRDKFAEINGIPALYSIFPVEGETGRSGAVLRVEDISAMNQVIRERDEALLFVEEMKKIIDDSVFEWEGFSQLDGESKAMRNIKKLAYKASRSNSTVLILGESGTGKTFLAESIHKAGSKRNQAFIHVNCGAMPETLLESELFGYERGSFTGASTEGKIGLFEKAKGGTIFLDEIGDLSLTSQVKLLKVLQDKTFFKIGGTTEISTDVRIIAATNRNLEDEIRCGRFREDLFYRLNVFPIWMPALRERKEDIDALSNRFLKRICIRLGCEDKFISPDVQKCLLSYDWPGNIRELENVLERAANISDGRIINMAHLPSKITGNHMKSAQSEWKSFKESIEEAEKKAIVEALAYYKNDKKKAMKALQIGKTNFYEKLNKYGIR